MALGEWGSTLRSDGHGGNDNTLYIQKMYDFITNPANNVAFHVYLNVKAPDGDHNLSGGDGATKFPQASALFKKLFTTTTSKSPIAQTDAKTLVSRHSQKCLDVAGATSAAGADVIQYTCFNAVNQRFSFIPAGNNQYLIKAHHSGKCLEVTGKSTANNALIQQQQDDCQGEPHQRFTLKSMGSGYYFDPCGQQRKVLGHHRLFKRKRWKTSAIHLHGFR